MNLRISILILLICSVSIYYLSYKSVDEQLSIVIKEHNLRPLPIKPVETNPKFELGEMLFNDTILSAGDNIACATCHIPDLGSIDQRRIAIGPNDVEHERNTPDIFNRDHNTAKSLLWDGSIEVLDRNLDTFRTPLLDMLPNGFQNLMAAQ